MPTTKNWSNWFLKRSPNMAAKHWFTPLKIFLMSLGVFVVGTGIVLGGVAYYYHSRYYPEVQAAGVVLTGQAQDSGKALLTQKADHYLQQPVHITLPDITKPLDPNTNTYPDQEFVVPAQQLGLNFNTDQVAANAWVIGHTNNLGTWLKETIPFFFRGSKQNLAYAIDAEKLNSYVHTQIIPLIRTPIPAKVSIDGKTVSVTPPQAGLDIDETALVTQLASSLQTISDGDTIYLRAPAQEVYSPLTVPVVQPFADRLNTLGDLKITLSGTDLSVTAKREDILTWFAPVQDEQGNLSLVYEKEVVTAYLQKQKDLDQTKAIDQVGKVLASVTSGDLKTLAPNNRLVIQVATKPKVPVVATPGAYTVSEYPGKYVEVSLADQRLYLIDGENLVKTYVISSGKWATPTPKGRFSIHDKTPRAYSAAYGLYMPYWEDFLDGQYGLHELPEWPNGYKEGQNHLGVPVSHGCVRLGVGDAKEVYNWTEIGTPVYIF